jgi:predicted transcriptional regulator
MKHDRSYNTHEEREALFNALRIFFTTDSDELTMNEFASKANVFYKTLWNALNGKAVTNESQRRIYQAIETHKAEIQEALQTINGSTNQGQTWNT